MRGDTGGNRTPQWHKIRIEQTHGAESDHRDREDCVTYARDAHRRGLRVTIHFNGNLMNASSSPRSEHLGRHRQWDFGVRHQLTVQVLINAVTGEVEIGRKFTCPVTRLTRSWLLSLNESG